MMRRSRRALVRALAAVAAIVGFGLLWRLLSRRYRMPCPASFAWLVEGGGVMDRIAGSALLLDRLGLEPGMKVLDAGCGPGRLTIPAARRVGPEGAVLAVDVQPAMLRRTREKAAAAGLGNVQLLEAPLGGGRIAPATFDRALLVTVLGEIPDRDAALAEIFAALKPGGVLSVTEILPDPHYQRRATVRRLAEAAGFRPDRTFGRPWAYTLNLVKPVTEGGTGPAGSGADSGDLV